MIEPDIHVVAPLLYGPSWQTPLHLATGYSIRTVHRWAVGEGQPSADAWRKIEELVCERERELAGIKRLLRATNGAAKPGDAITAVGGPRL